MKTDKQFGQKTGTVVYVRILEYDVGRAGKKSNCTKTMTIHNHKLAEVRDVIEKALAEAFGRLQV